MAAYSTCNSVVAPIINSIFEPASSLPFIAHCENALEVYKVIVLIIIIILLLLLFLLLLLLLLLFPSSKNLVLIFDNNLTLNLTATGQCYQHLG